MLESRPRIVGDFLMMKQWISVLAFLIILSVGVSGQKENSGGVVLSGAVIRVSPTIRQGTDQPFVVYEVVLQLQLRNEGTAPVIVFDPLSSFCERRIEFLNVPTFDVDAVPDLVTSPWINPWVVARERARYVDPWPSFLKSLASAAEPSESFLILGPGRLHEFSEVVTLNEGFSLTIKPGQALKEIQRNSPTSDFPALRIQYHLSVKQLRDDELLKTLQQRWVRFGHLVLDGNGDFTLESETILNKIS